MDDIWRSVLHGLDDGILMFHQGELLFANARTQSLLRKMGADEIFFTADEFFALVGMPPLDPSQLQETRVLQRSGGSFTITRRQPGGDVLVVLVRDTSQEEQRVEETLSRTSDLLFQIRSRITTVQNALTLLTQYGGRLTAPEARDLSSGASHELWQLERYLDNIRDSALMGSRVLADSLRPEPIRFEDAVHEATETIRNHPPLGGRELHVEARIPNGLSTRADHTRLQRILESLLLNALLYGEANEVVLAEAFRDGAQACIAISNGGSGIPPLEQTKIFNPGFRGSNARDSAFQGSGKDLWFSRMLAGRMGGSLEFESMPGRSTFTLRLPVVEDRAR